MKLGILRPAVFGFIAAYVLWCAFAGCSSSKSKSAYFAPPPATGTSTGTSTGTGTGAPTGTGTDTGTPFPGVRVRNWFPETLYVEPSIITDASGNAAISLNVADSITDWRLTALASATDGRLGSTTEAIRCFQDFFVDINLPVYVTQHDEFHVPCVLYNYMTYYQDVQVQLSCASWFTSIGPTEHDVNLAPGEVTSVYFPIRVEGVGTQGLTVYGIGSVMNDAIMRVLRIEPDGEPVTGTISTSLGNAVPQEFLFDIPPSHIAGADDCYIKLYAGYVTQVIEGIESLVKKPFG